MLELLSATERTSVECWSACGGDSELEQRSCGEFQLETGEWREEPYRLREDRYQHVSWTLATGEVMLVGGTPSPTTTEIITPGVQSRQGFNLTQST